MGEQNPYDVLEASKDVVRDLNRALYGEPASHTPGLFDKVDTLSHKLDKLSADIDKMQRKRPNITNWVLGFGVFCGSGFFAIITVVHLVTGQTLWNLPIEVSATTAAILALVALLFFLTGFGWIGGE